MKKKFVLLLACLMVFALVLTGCGGSGVVGTTWKLDRGEASGVTVNAELLKSTVGDMSIAFKDEKTCEMTVMGATAEGTYTLNGDKLVLTFNGSDQEATLDGNEITMEQSGIKIIFKKN